MLSVAMPLAAISVLQQFFNAADVAVVGRFASDNALAAVGTNTPIVNMFVTFFTGLSTGGNVAIATLIGRGERSKLRDAVRTIYGLSLICAICLIIIGETFAGTILKLVDAPDTIMYQALLYLRIYLVAQAFGVIYNFGSAILRSKGDTKRPLYILMTAGTINILLNIFFVIVLKLDVAGVALATLISNIICAVSITILLLKETDELQLNFSGKIFSHEVMQYTMKIGLPSGIQGLLFSVSNVILQSGVNSFGATCIAGNTAALNYEYISYFVVSAFGQTATTFTSQNYGAGKAKRCRKVLYQSMLLGFLCCLLVSSCFVFFENFWLGLFTQSTAVLKFAKIRMRYVTILECLTAFNEMTGAGLRGIGISVPPTLLSIAGSCILRIIWVNTIFAVHHTIEVLLLVYPVSWILLGIVGIPMYFILSKKRLLNYCE